MSDTPKQRKKKKRRASSDSTLLIVGIGVGVVLAAAVAAYFYFRKNAGDEEKQRHAAIARVQATTGFTPALFDVTPAQQKELDAWQPPKEGQQLTMRAEYMNSRRAAQREVAAKAAAEAAATVNDE